GLAADDPGSPPLGREPAAMPLDRGVGRNIDPGLGAGAVAEPLDGVEKAEPLDEFDALLGGFTVDICPDRHMVGSSFENNRRRRRFGYSPPQPHRTGVTRMGRHPVAPC